MKFFYLLVAIILLRPFGIWAQGENNIWIFGNGSGIDFNSGTAVAISSNCSAWEGTASICDADGNLLFYSNGERIWNKEHDTMNGGSIIVSSTSISSSSQACIIVPVPGSDTLFYVFSLESEEDGDGGLYYTVVDMSLNSGLGDVIVDETGILIEDGLTEKMTAVAGDCNNVWLITHSLTRNEYYSYEITKYGISAPVVSVIGTGAYEFGYQVGVIKVSPDRTHMAAGLSGLTKGAEIYDFDAATGIISNRQVLINSSSEFWDGGEYYGACFSPDNSKIYFSNASQIVQFDLSLGTLEDIIASGTYIGEARYGDLRVAPDGKIYIPWRYGNLSTIDSPNLAGTACVFNYMSFEPSGSLGIGLPNVIAIASEYPDSNEVFIHDTTFCTTLTISGRENGTAYLWNTGDTTESITISTAGTYWVRSRNVCSYFDSFYVRPMFDSAVSATICEGDTLAFGSLLLTAAGSYSSAFPSVSGCDSIVTLSLLTKSRSETTINDTICNGEAYHFNGETFTTPQSGVEFGFTNYLGCDSIVTLNLVVNPTGNVTINDTICAGETYIFNGVPYTSSIEGETIVLSNIYGCDSTITLNLVVHPVSAFTLNDTICAGESYTFNGSVYTGSISGVMAVFSNIYGCDSTVTLNLHVNPLPIIDLGADTSVCIGASLILDAGNPGSTYTWNTGEITQTISAGIGGHVVSVTDIFGCENSGEIEISLNIPFPAADGFNFIPLFEEARGRVKFNVLNPDNIESYHWLFGDGGESSESDPVHTFSTGGIYNVLLIIGNGCGSDTLELPVNVDLATGIVDLLNSDEVLVYPNPANEILKIKPTDKLKIRSVDIYNVIGQAVYKYKNISNDEVAIDVNTFRNGSYLVHILTDKGAATRKVQIVH